MWTNGGLGQNGLPVDRIISSYKIRPQKSQIRSLLYTLFVWWFEFGYVTVWNQVLDDRAKLDWNVSDTLAYKNPTTHVVFFTKTIGFT